MRTKAARGESDPGWCREGHLAKMCSFTELDYAQMLEAILDAAVLRIEREYSRANVSKS